MKCHLVLTLTPTPPSLDRRMLKEEKRKLIIRMRFDQLKRETLVLQQMPAKYDDSMRQLER